MFAGGCGLDRGFVEACGSVVIDDDAHENQSGEDFADVVSEKWALCLFGRLRLVRLGLLCGE